ncbi:MAG TPA: hypothetical protein VKU93_01110 [Terracidiphilus sp.]|jgi:hypothetical protein|nr:hypothetical protein [Terracidiphilus sp.]
MNPAWENGNGAGTQDRDGAGQLRQPAELSEWDSTLRLIASVSVPEGLEERVHAALRAAPGGARLLAWPAALRPRHAWISGGWSRAAAAAAIVFVVAGGGWGVYMRLPHSPKAVTMPAAQKTGGFSSAGAIRTPDSIQGPVLTKRMAAAPLPAKPTARGKAHPGRPKAKKAETASPAASVAPAAVPVQR